jgi:prophage regulatory protein
MKTISHPDRLLRLEDIIGDPSGDPPKQALIPVGRTTWFNGVKSGRFPAPTKLGRFNVWRGSVINELVEQIAEGTAL